MGIEKIDIQSSGCLMTGDICYLALLPGLENIFHEALAGGCNGGFA